MERQMTDVVIQENKLFKLIKENIGAYELNVFFKNCNINNVVPNFLIMDDKFYNPEDFRNIIYMFQKRSLKKLISCNYIKMKKQKIEIKNIKRYLKTIHLNYIDLINRINDYTKFIKEKLSKKYNNKIIHLCIKKGYNIDKKYFNNSLNDFKSTTVLNNTNTILSNKQIEILSKGPKYIPNCKKINKLDLLVDLENGLNKLQNNDNINNNEINNVVNIVKGTYNNKFNNLNKFEFNRTLNKKELIEIKEIENLKKLSKDIVFTKPDKQRNILIIDKNEYINKMENHLNNKQIFEIHNNINLNIIGKKFKEENNEIIKKINNKYINLNIVNKYPKIPIPYGFPKINKQNCPLRVIIPSIGSITYNLSKFMYGYLVNDIPYFYKRVNNVLQIKDELLKIGKFNYKLTKFDVVSLYDNIPLNLTIEIILNNHINNLSNKTLKLDNFEIKKLLVYKR